MVDNSDALAAEAIRLGLKYVKCLKKADLQRQSQAYLIMYLHTFAYYGILYACIYIHIYVCATASA